MKSFLALIVLASSATVFADAKMVDKCISTTQANIRKSAILCAGVNSDAEIKLVQNCFLEGPNNGDQGAILCSGIKSNTEMKALFACYQAIDASGVRSTILCAGVKNENEISGIQKCYGEALEKYDPDFASISCSKDARAAHLLKDLVDRKDDQQVDPAPVVVAPTPVPKKPKSPYLP